MWSHEATLFISLLIGSTCHYCTWAVCDDSWCRLKTRYLSLPTGCGGVEYNWNRKNIVNIGVALYWCQYWRTLTSNIQHPDTRTSVTDLVLVRGGGQWPHCISISITLPWHWRWGQDEPLISWNNYIVDWKRLEGRWGIMVLGPDCNQGDILRNQYHSGIIFAIIFLKFSAFSHLICSSHSMISVLQGAWESLSRKPWLISTFHLEIK